MDNSAPCYWITGLSAAGKTTIAESFVRMIRNLDMPVVFLDGDVMRGILNHNAFTKDERLAFGYVYSRLAKHLTCQGVTVVVAVIGLFAELQQWNRSNIPNYVEVFLDVPLDELERRDPKGIYQKYKEGLIKNVAGLDMSVDLPTAPDFHFKWEDQKTFNLAPQLLLRHFQSTMKNIK